MFKSACVCNRVFCNSIYSHHPWSVTPCTIIHMFMVNACKLSQNQYDNVGIMIMISFAGIVDPCDQSEHRIRHHLCRKAFKCLKCYGIDPMLAVLFWYWWCSRTLHHVCRDIMWDFRDHFCRCPLLVTVNSSPHSAAYMHQWIGPALVQIMACHLFGPKSL